MNGKLKVLLAALLITSVFTREKICQHLGFGGAKVHSSSPVVKDEVVLPQTPPTTNGNSFVNDTLYYWDKQLLDWMPLERVITSSNKPEVVASDETSNETANSLELTWETLTNIHYRLRYFSELDMEIFASVFPKTIQLLDGQEVTVEGFVIPFDEEGEILALSQNPYAACFFCGKASPASVISMYLKNTDQTYKVDDFKKFKGTLRLNSDNPNEFYYILDAAREE